MASNIIWQHAAPQETSMHAFMRTIEEKYSVLIKNYQELHDWSIKNPTLFWPEVLNFFNVKLTGKINKVTTQTTPKPNIKWFDGGYLNFAEYLLHNANPETTIISIQEDGLEKKLSKNELIKQVAQFAGGLKKRGVQAGDRVAAIMPNTAETIIAMLATASVGAIWSSCSPDFGSDALIDRISQIKPKILLCTNRYQYLGKNYDLYEKITKIKQEVPSIEQIVIAPFRTDDNLKLSKDVMNWDSFITSEEQLGSTASTFRGLSAESIDPSDKPRGVGLEVNYQQTLQFESYPFDHPLYILFSSGTTGKPKCIAHGAGNTLIQHLKELGLHTDIQAKDTMLFYTTCGWMMWNWMVSTLALGATLVIYEGAPMHPTPSRLFDIIEKYGVTVFGTSARYLSALEQEQQAPGKQHDLKKLRSILSTGSPLLPSQYDYIQTNIGKNIQISSISGGTDIISCFGLGNPLTPVYRGEIQSIGLGMQVAVYDESGKPVIDEKGELVCENSFPSMPIYFFNDADNQKYHQAYFSRFKNTWAHGDFATLTHNCGLIIYGRSDTTLNRGGVRIGTAEIYRQLAKIAEIKDCVAVEQTWNNDTRVILFVELHEKHKLDTALEQKIKHTLRQNASPRHVPDIIVQVYDIPKTINGKVVESAVKNIVNHEEINNINSIANPQSIADIRNACSDL